MADRLRLDRFLPYLLSVTSNRVSERIARTYDALFGLSIPEWRLIAVIAEAPGITQADIGERTRMDKVTVSRAAIALAARGLLERAPNAADRRSRHLSLSAAGHALYEQVAPKALELERRLFARFDAGELRQLTEMLRRIDAAVAEENG
ncbi:MarR family winged helix-turn-helix transcriptional regulator [Sphingomonas corticis]|jgi:DNA-binding MarR family transcriptional regulator|uniref:MarR family transcriptional regulator n=1 Tax=Sphingomonas corticis TaxID=2722791 RepID=A0ABX1CQF7_9SPHN|nr:MarR family transcriptional regulator [Sphingomonas corticis]NJR80174.1 MarR family transcriptional regulator [Sphingomonas corticis]